MARLVKYGLAGDSTREELARQTILIAGKRVQALYKRVIPYIPLMEHQDATMETAERAFARMGDYWNPERGAWSPYVAIIARGVVRDRLTKKRREKETIEHLKKEMDENQSEEFTLTQSG